MVGNTLQIADDIQEDDALGGRAFVPGDPLHVGFPQFLSQSVNLVLQIFDLLHTFPALLRLLASSGRNGALNGLHRQLQPYMLRLI